MSMWPESNNVPVNVRPPVLLIYRPSFQWKEMASQLTVSNYMTVATLILLHEDITRAEIGASETIILRFYPFPPSPSLFLNVRSYIYA